MIRKQYKKNIYLNSLIIKTRFVYEMLCTVNRDKKMRNHIPSWP